MPSDAVIQRAERKLAAEKSELADAAFEVFADRGYHATRIADITAHLGVGQSSFYKHFDNKRDLVSHVIDTLTLDLMTTLLAENAAGEAESLEDYLGQVGRIFELIFDTLAAHPSVIRVLVRDAASIDDEFEQRWNTTFDLTRDVVAAYYENGIDKGYFQADIDVTASAEACVGLLLGGLYRMARQPGDRAGYDAYVDAALRLVVGGATNPRSADR